MKTLKTALASSLLGLAVIARAFATKLNAARSIAAC